MLYGSAVGETAGRRPGRSRTERPTGPGRECVLRAFFPMRLFIRRMPPFIKRQDRRLEKMEPGTEKTSRKPRADSIRNRERLLDAATQIFSAGGPQASLEAVARQAGV